eukprot:m.18852 g.18852  ORF g.18852 m.18852 type:complete len:539 (-) comp3377_c0_seq1:95-1711(-)
MASHATSSILPGPPAPLSADAHEQDSVRAAPSLADALPASAGDEPAQPMHCGSDEALPATAARPADKASCSAGTGTCGEIACEQPPAPLALPASGQACGRSCSTGACSDVATPAPATVAPSEPVSKSCGISKGCGPMSSCGDKAAKSPAPTCSKSCGTSCKPAVAVAESTKPSAPISSKSCSSSGNCSGKKQCGTSCAPASVAASGKSCRAGSSCSGAESCETKACTPRPDSCVSSTSCTAAGATAETKSAAPAGKKGCCSGGACTDGPASKPVTERTALLSSFPNRDTSDDDSEPNGGVCYSVSISWLDFARALAFISIFWNILEGASAIYAGVADFQLSVLVYGIQSIIEVVSAALVWWRLSRGAALKDKAALVARERKALRTIGVLFVVLALCVVAGAVIEFVRHDGPSDTFLGLLVSSIAAAAMLVLYLLKVRAARHLDSRILREDAMCSKYCCMLAMIVITASLINMLQGRIDDVCSSSACNFWWVDGAFATAIALWIMRDGVRAVRTSYRPDFDGGCGCCSDSSPAPALSVN